MPQTKQLKRWSSDFGIEYTDRNVIDPNIRINAFKKMIENIQIYKILEVGCNVGHNLISLSKIGNFKLIGIEPLEYAVLKGRASSNEISILEGNAFDIPFKDNYFDLVFTCGVLIHISPEEIFLAMDEIYRASKKNILIIEYYAEKETIIHYREYNDMLWKRNFKKLFLNRYPQLKLIKNGLLERKNGFDNTHWWLFGKTTMY